jgi:hypothetical protein
LFGNHLLRGGNIDSFSRRPGVTATLSFFHHKV